MNTFILVTRHAGLKFPPWLNEGIAELYSNLRTLGDEVLVGDLIPGRLQALYSQKWVPLSVILSAGPDSPYYNEKNKAGSLYNEGWGLVHMLQLSPAYVAKFPDFLSNVQGGADSAAALEKVYGKTVSAVENDLQAYIRGTQFYGRLFPVKLSTSKEKFLATPAPMFDLKLALADLTNRPGKEAATQKTLEDLAREDPKRPEPWAGMGYLAWRGNHVDEAVEAFGKAYELGDRNSQLLWDFGRLAESGHSDSAIQALTDLSYLEPERVDVRMELAALHLSARRAGAALGVLVDVKSVTSEEAPRFFTLLAEAQIRLGDRAGARITVANLATNAKTPADRTRAAEMQRYLDQADAPELVRIAPLQTPRPPRPTLTVEQPPEQPAPEIEGSFVEFVCSDRSLKVVIDTAQGKKSFLIPDPKRIVVMGRAGGKVDLNCGPQAPVHVKLEYTPSSAAADADGLLKILYFDP